MYDIASQPHDTFCRSKRENGKVGSGKPSTGTEEAEETENQVIAEDMVEGEKGTSVKTERQIQPEEWDTVRQEVLTIVSRRYLEPSLKRVEVIGM